MGNDKTDWGVMAVIITVGLCGAAYFIQGALASKNSNETDIGEKTGEFFTSIKNSLKGGSATKRRKKSKGKGKSHKKH